MRRHATLFELEEVFRDQLHRLRYYVILAQRQKIAYEREMRISHVAINLQNSWANFVKAYYLSCSFGTKTKSLKAVRSPHYFSDQNSAIGFAIQAIKPHALPNAAGKWHRRDEPAWHDMNNLLNLSTRLNFQNNGELQNAFSLNLAVFQHLPVFRNFYAHRNRQTLEAVQLISFQYGLPSNSRATELLLSNPRSRPQLLVLEWIDELRITADFMCI